MHIRSLLFVGRRNAARSIMAEACFNTAAVTGWRAFSAGWQTQHQVDSMALRTLAKQNFPTDALYSKPVDIFLQEGAPAIDLCVFMDNHLPHDAGDYPGETEHWRIANPHGKTDVSLAYAQTLDLVTERISDLILSGRLYRPREPLPIAI